MNVHVNPSDPAQYMGNGNNNNNGLMASRNFWNQLLEKAFLALVAWFLFNLVQDIKILNTSIQELNQKMAVVINEVSNQKTEIQNLKGDVDWLNKNSVRTKGK